MVRVPDIGGRFAAGSFEASPAGAAMLYVKVPLEASLKVSVKVPTSVCWRLLPDCVYGVPLST